MKFSYSKFNFANMKTIVTLIFLGYLGCTFACYDSMPRPKCQDLENKAQLIFSAESFFTGDWYVTHSKNQGGTSECSKFETSKIFKINLNYQSGLFPMICLNMPCECSLRPNPLSFVSMNYEAPSKTNTIGAHSQGVASLKDVTVTYFRMCKLLVQGKKVQCTGDDNTMKKYICFDCEVTGSQSTFKKFFLVLEADSYYADYALVYVCNQSGTTTNDNFLVLQRRKSKDLPSGISSVLSKVQLKQSELKSNKCK